jgi:hypothetical protein
MEHRKVRSNLARATGPGFARNRTELERGGIIRRLLGCSTICDVYQRLRLRLDSYAPSVLVVCYNRDMQRDDTDVVVKLKTESRGVVNPAIVRWIAFVVITLSLVACTVLCILAIWKFTESDAVWRAIATFIVVSIATAIFTFVNEKLG